MAALHASSGEHTHGERTILRAAGFADLVKASSAFRRRAAFEFAQAPGLPVSTRLYLPYYCCMKEVEQTGPPLFDIISEARLHPSRVIVELLSPPAGVGASAEHLEPLRARGVALSLRVADAEDAHLETSDALNPSYVHVTRPPGSYDEIGRYKSFCSALLERGVRLVLGGIDRGEDASLAEGLGASLFAGDAIAPARFLV